MSANAKAEIRLIRGRQEIGQLPADREAERAVLGTVLLDDSVPSQALSIVLGLLTASDFYLPQHQHVFAAMRRLFESGVPVDAVTILDDLTQNGELEAAGGAAYLSTLADGLPRITNVNHYAHIVRKKAALRQIASLADQALSSAVKLGAEPGTIAGRAAEGFARVVEDAGLGFVSGSGDELIRVPDLPDDVLDGRLGGICEKRFLRLGFPIAYAWLALVTVSGTRTSQSTVRTNLYTALVGRVGTGKSVTANHAFDVMGVSDPIRQQIMAGSAEGLMDRLVDAEGQPRLIDVDELRHLLAKCRIDNASYPSVLNRSFYETRFEMIAARRRQIAVNCVLGIIGGVVEDDFAHCFGSATTGGLHDRFIFGRCPQPFEFSWRPFEGAPEEIEPCSVAVAPDVWDARDEWLKTIPNLTPRHAEHALRVAVIAASFSGRTTLMAKHLGPARAFAEYQARVRALLRPNPGENPDAVCAFAILSTLEDRKWMDEREVRRKIHAERLGPGVFRRAVENLEFSGDIERVLEGRRRRVRRSA